MSTFYPTDYTPEVLADIAEERVRQHEKWGPQHHPDFITLGVPAVPIEKPMTNVWYANQAEQWKEANDVRVERGHVAWDGILLEEVFEALAESDTEKLRTELIQVAAVACAWVEDIMSREANADANAG